MAPDQSLHAQPAASGGGSPTPFMRVLVLSINYAPEPTGFAPHVTALCEHLVRVQHEVMTISGFPFAPYWSRSGDKGRGWIAGERRNGVQLFRVRHFVPSHPRRVLERLLMEGSYCLLALATVLIRRRIHADVILYVGAQPSIAMLARWLGWWQRTPYVVAINDLAAHAAQEVGIVRRSWLASALACFERAAYRKASRAFVLCQAFKDALVDDGFPAEKVRVIPSPVDVNLVRPAGDRALFRRAHGIDPRAFVVLYAGSMGMKQDLETIVDAAKILGCAAGVIWVLVGDGERKDDIVQRVARERVAGCVLILPFEHETGMAAMFAAADVLILSQLASVKDTVIPSKLLTYMASGRPVVATVHPRSEAAWLIRQTGGGELVAPQNPAALAATIAQLMLDRSRLEELGARNRRYAEAMFDVRRIVELQEEVLRDAVTQARRPQWRPADHGSGADRTPPPAAFGSF